MHPGMHQGFRSPAKRQRTTVADIHHIFFNSNLYRNKRAGALCFYRKAEKVISGCYVKIGKFEGSDLLYQDEVRGSLLIIADTSLRNKKVCQCITS